MKLFTRQNAINYTVETSDWNFQFFLLFFWMNGRSNKTQNSNDWLLFTDKMSWTKTQI